MIGQFNLLRIILICCFIFLYISTPQVAKAAFFSFEPDSKIVNPGETFEVKLNIDTQGQDTILGEALISFDSNILEVVEVKEGGFFPSLAHNITINKLYVGAFVTDIKNESRIGRGILLTITFKALAEGNSKVEFACSQANLSDSNITGKGPEFADLIRCDKLNLATYIVQRNFPSPTRKLIPTYLDPTITNIKQATSASTNLVKVATFALFVGISIFFVFLTYLIIRAKVKSRLKQEL